MVMDETRIFARNNISAKPIGEGISLCNFGIIHVASVAIDEVASPIGGRGRGDGFEGHWSVPLVGLIAKIFDRPKRPSVSIPKSVK
jgi:uncharacterized protein YqgC (DUF456 family)